LRLSSTKTNFLILLLVAAAPVGFLSVPHWINAALFLLAILLPIHKTLLVDPTSGANPKTKQSQLIVVVFLAPIVAVLLGQSLRGTWQWSDYDAPSRLLLGLVVYTALAKAGRPSASNVLSALAVGLILTLAVLPLGITTQAMQRWGGRFATALSDTNTFGSYVGLIVILSICLIVFSQPRNAHSRKLSQQSLRWLALIPVGVGIWALIGSQSRGAWISAAGALFAATWILFSRSRASNVATGTLVTVLCIALAISLGASHGVFGRLESISQELWAAFHGHYRPDSGGVRIQMYRAALDLIWAAPFTGYGDLGYKLALESPVLRAQYPPEVLNMLGGAGPHSEIFGRALQSGLWGVIGVALHLGIPCLIFWKNGQVDSSSLGRVINSTGLVLMTYLILVQFSIEFTLKHTASFNALLLALLLAISVKSAHESGQPRQKSN
jgi:O-antigen ligase